MYGAEPCPKPSDPRAIGQLHPRSVGAIVVAVLLSEDRDGDTVATNSLITLGCMLSASPFE